MRKGHEERMSQSGLEVKSYLAYIGVLHDDQNGSIIITESAIKARCLEAG